MKGLVRTQKPTKASQKLRLGKGGNGWAKRLLGSSWLVPPPSVLRFAPLKTNNQDEPVMITVLSLIIERVISII